MRAARFLLLALPFWTLTAFALPDGCQGTLAKDWKNADNKDFYDHLPIPVFQKRAEECGLAGCPDLLLPSVRIPLGKMLGPYIRSSEDKCRVLEIGAGYGRVVDWLLEESDGCQIVALEHSHNLAEHLRKKYEREPRVRVLEQSLLTLDFGFEVQAALWMWSGITEFNPTEKRLALEKVFEALSRKGLLVIDLPGEKRAGYLLSESRGNFVQFAFGPAVLNLHTIGHEELVLLAEKVGLSALCLSEYVTEAGLPRRVLTFLKP